MPEALAVPERLEVKDWLTLPVMLCVGEPLRESDDVLDSVGVPVKLDVAD